MHGVVFPHSTAGEGFLSPAVYAGVYSAFMFHMLCNKLSAVYTAGNVFSWKSRLLLQALKVDNFLKKAGASRNYRYEQEWKLGKFFLVCL